MTSPTLRQLAQFTLQQLESAEDRSKVVAMVASELSESSRLDQVDQYIEQLNAQYELAGMQAQVSITSATNISNDIKKKFEQDLRTILGVDTVKADFSDDPQLLSGVTIQSSVVHIDLSGQGLLTQLRQKGFVG